VGSAGFRLSTGYPKQAVELEDKTPEVGDDDLDRHIGEMLAKLGLCLVKIPDAIDAGVIGKVEFSLPLLPTGNTHAEVANADVAIPDTPDRSEGN
jgi:hypothetical protein